ncbi:MAG: undecaprenyl/decaprenyl-phosphate alpha-N-acetylglucosaminyl 1-phosphate transferase [Candidatus Omnitrophica bacterium]|nr:undecaprenyl/decaprenyl-phosphate alpha-N-acetylglucosaminyl 1-phosphate transferase [Candidatus Omnitrophota bacterium]MCG2703740.1 undecaprenyl/decaprenyl-phosphate alpha-N-acetylglucosaminyl 1-phosphate transferase [Candidatus Omnitrophota bacterium]
MLIYNTILFFGSFFLCYLLIPVFERIALKMGFVTTPAPGKIDRRKIPYCGGVAVFLSFLLIGSCILNFPLFYIRGNVFLPFLSTAAVIVFFGAYDDAKELSPLRKLAAQICGAVLIVLLSAKTQIMYIPDIMNCAISVLWIVVVINAFNLLDIIDGLAGSIALINCITFFIFAFLTGNYFVMAVSLMLSGFLTAFLRYNLPPARVFMGDAGSQFLGFSLAVLAIHLSFASYGHEVGLLIPVVILVVPLFDLLFVVFMRRRQKKSIFLKSNDHFVFRMLQSGISNRKIIMAMSSVSLVASSCAFFIYRGSNEFGITIFILLIFSLLVYGNKLSRLEVNK